MSFHKDEKERSSAALVDNKMDIRHGEKSNENGKKKSTLVI